MKKLLIALIKLYQKTPCSSHSQCRYIPTCSNYAIEAINVYGSIKGSFLALKRILRCNPLGGYGYDPVPRKKEKKEMKKNKFLLLMTIFIGIFFMTTGCTNDNMENIDVLVTSYANEYIVQELYGEHAIITSIYPDGVDITNYQISKKNKNDYSKYDLFIYNGLIEKERNLAVDLLDINPDLKIIDTAYVLETDYSPEELWLNPSSLLMMAQNVRLGLEEYIDSNVLKEEIDLAYDDLKVKLSELDVSYRIDVENTNNKIIVVSNSALKYLEKFGLQVYCIDADATEKTISDVQNLINDKKINYIFSFKEENQNDNVKKLSEENEGISVLQLHKLDNITDEERNNKENYLTIMQSNLETIKKEIY